MVSVNDNHYRRDLSHISRDLFTIMMPALIVAQKLELIAGDGSCDSNRLFLLGVAFDQLSLRQM